jgi:hypothetical protein
MKNYAIQSGSFTENGNFSGYTALGERLHIHKRQLTSLGWTKIEDVKFPFYAIGDVKQIGQLDENNAPKVNTDGSAVLVDRLTAMSVFGTKEGLVNAHVDVATLGVEIASSIKAKATSAGLTEDAVNILLAASV